MQKVVIVGGGIAGLTAAYYLSKHGDYSIDLYESSDKLGGRIQTQMVDGYPFDHGAFMLMPWYRYLDKLLLDIGLSASTVRLSDNHEYSWDASNASFHRINKAFIYDDAPKLSLAKTLPDFIAHKAALLNPDPYRFNGESIATYTNRLDSSGKLAHVANQLIAGYAYGPIDELPLSIYFGSAKNLLLRKGFKNIRMIDGGVDTIITTLAKKLQQNGVKIHLNSPISITDERKVSIKNKPLTYEHVIIAAAQANLLQPFFTGTEQPITYSNHYVAMLRTDKSLAINDTYDWDVVYTATTDESNVQLVNVGNISGFHNGPACAYIACMRIPREDTSTYTNTQAKKDYIRLFKQIFPEATNPQVAFMHHWRHTMPILQPDTLAHIQSLQGKDNIYFAGDYLGAPSMEVAIQSGVYVSDLIKNSYL